MAACGLAAAAALGLWLMTRQPQQQLQQQMERQQPVQQQTAACDPQLDWEHTIASRDRFRDPDVEVSMHRYTNAMQFGLAGPDRVQKGEITLAEGQVLRYGTNAPLMPELPIVEWPRPLWYVAQRYPRPCAVPAEEGFRFRVEEDKMWGKGLVEVHGTVHRRGSAIDYELSAEPVGDPGRAVFHASGRWTVGMPEPIPETFDVRGWKPVRGTPGQPPEEWKADEGASLATIAEARRYRSD